MTPLDDWGEIVRADLTRAVDGLIAAGRHLRQAKAEHRGEFKAWVGSGALNIGYRQVARLMAIAEHLDDLKGDTACHLPKDTLVLYEMAVHLGRRQIEALVAEGAVHPGLNRDGLRMLLRSMHGAEPPQLELIQQRWSPRRGYFPRPPRPVKRAPAPPPKGRRTPPVWARLVAAANLNLVALESNDDEIRLAELAKLKAAITAEIESGPTSSKPGCSTEPGDIRRTSS